MDPLSNSGPMASDRVAFQDKRRAWLTAAMLAAGALLLGMAVIQGFHAWQRDRAERSVESVPLLEAGADGFVPMLSSEINVESGERPGASGGLSGYPSPGDGNAGRTGAPAVVPEPAGDLPVRLVIPKIGLTAPIVGAGLSMVKVGGKEYYQWDAPDFFAAGWHRDTARLGAGSNTVLDGHHNVDGEVFRDLHLLEPGDLIVVFGSGQEHRYRVTERLILKEKYQDLETRLANARWIQATAGERLTLVTCWPYETNTHRLFIIAEPLGADVGGGELPID
jgi:LPXTG-site transpeptidase (sortase) family protein